MLRLGALSSPLPPSILLQKAYIPSCPCRFWRQRLSACRSDQAGRRLAGRGANATMIVEQPGFWLAVLQIIWIDILLSGDNAVVIALACRKLPSRQRVWGIVL